MSFCDKTCSSRSEEYGRKCGKDVKDFTQTNCMEILAPATASTYKEAVLSGADAIYFGYGSLNARASADNLDSFSEIVNFCHKNGVKAYLALNIMLKDNEIDKAVEIIDEAEKAKIDAFIITDFSLVPIIKERTKAALHASTQIGVHNVSGAKFCRELGFDRVILSRETTKEDIKAIINAVDIEVEIFGHGAICAGFSGACLFSSMLTGKSGNRGRCAQLCRRKYSCYADGIKKDEGYLISPKDNCMAQKIQEIKELHVASLKIEGRLKNVNYISGVTEIYSELNYGKKFDEELSDRLKACFNRGNFTAGYWDGKDIIYKGAPNHIGVFYGKVVKILSKNLILLKTKRPIKKDDSFRIVRKGMEIGGAVCTGEEKKYDKETLYVCFSPCGTEIGDAAYLTKTEVPLTALPKKKITVSVKLNADFPAEIRAECEGAKYEYIGETVQRAKTAPITEKDIMEQFARGGGEDYEIEVISAETENAFLPKSKLNALRRAVTEYFSAYIIENYSRPETNLYKPLAKREKIDGDFVKIDSAQQLSEKVLQFKNIVYSPLTYTLQDCNDFYIKAKRFNNRIFIELPIFISTVNEEYAKKLVAIFDGVLANNIGAAYIAYEQNKFVVNGYNMNVANRKNILLDIANQTVISTELNAGELKNFNDCAVFTYGKLNLMYYVFCPKRLAVGCDKCSETKRFELRDDRGTYEIVAKKLNGFCVQEMKNSVTTNLGSLIKGKIGFFDFSSLDSSEIDLILEKYHSETWAETPEYNHLHFFRGVE